MLHEVIDALEERGYKPINQLLGYFMSGDPGYISSYKGARDKITRYDNLISTWTVRDVEKRNTAKKNNLNYLEIYPLYPFDKIVEFIHENYNSGTEGLQLIIGDEK